MERSKARLGKMGLACDVGWGREAQCSFNLQGAGRRAQAGWRKEPATVSRAAPLDFHGDAMRHCDKIKNDVLAGCQRVDLRRP